MYSTFACFIIFNGCRTSHVYDYTHSNSFFSFCRLKMFNTITVNCLVLGDIPPDECVFLIDISAEKTVFELKKMIKAEKINDFASIDADKLKLWKVNIPLYTPNQ